MTEKHRSILLNILLCLLVLMAGAGAFGGLAAMRKPPDKIEPVEKTFRVQVFEVGLDDVQEIIAGFGTARALHEVDCSAQIAGEIVSISQQLKVGEPVSGPTFESGASGPTGQSQQNPGELLLTIDPEVYQQRLQQTDHSIEEVSAELKKLDQEQINSQRLLARAERDYKLARDEHVRIEKLFRDGSVTESQLAQSQLDVQRYEESLLRLQNDLDLIPARREQLQTKLARLRTDRRLAAIDVSRSEVRPPFSGVLSLVHVDKGQYVQPGTPLFRVTQIDRVEIPVPLHPADHARVAGLLLAGQFPEVELAENELAAARWRGSVVRAAPRADQTTRTIDVFVEVDNEPGHPPLLPGTFVQARIAGPVLNDVLLIPREAVLGGHPRQGRVFVEQDGRVREVPVTVSRRLESVAFIESGLTPGQRVILTNLDVLTSGSSVEIQSVRRLDEEITAARLLRPADAAALPDAGRRPGTGE